jgi:hypothetical protein
MALPPREWSTQQSLPGGVNTKGGTNWPECLLKLQSRTQAALCNIACGPYSLRSGDHYTLKFELVTSPIGSYICLDLCLYVPPKSVKLTEEQHDRVKDKRMYAIFSTYDPEGDERYADRQVYDYRSKDNNVPPSGPLSFSQQLKDVRYSTGEVAEFEHLLFPGKNARDHSCFSWQSVRCHRFAFSRPLEDIHPSAVEAAQTFRQLIEHLVSGQQPVLVATSPMPLLAKVYWPWFAAIPAPVPESYWPWLHQPHVDPAEVMQFPANKPFERDASYVDTALAKREKGWWNSTEPVTIPRSLEIAHLDRVFRFHDPRQYLAYVLGAHAYEELHSNKTVGTSFNGPHTCDVFPETSSNDRPRYMVLLDIRQASKLGEVEKDALPDVGERVEINITLGGVRQSWTGRVVRIPSEYAKHGRNVAVVAEAAPYLSGYVQARSVVKADFFFGHSIKTSWKLQGSILRMMLDPTSPAQTWMRTLLLGHDNYTLPNNARAGLLPNGYQAHVDAICASRSLNDEQIQAVRHYFTHKVTIVRGPPGTGKSTLVDTILEIEEKLGKSVWVCTESNAAIDILAAKVCTRKGSMQPEANLRIRPVFDETLTVERVGESVTISALEDFAPQDGQDMAKVIEKFLRSSRNVARAMSLEATIKTRMGLLPQLKRGHGALWPGEGDDLVKLRDAYVARHGWRMEEGLSQEEVNEEDERLEKKYLRELRALQVNYVGRAMLVFSTAAAASGVLFERFAPNAMIMDEASQFIEARAVFPILQAMSKNRLERILLIGDDKQLPPTLMAPRNPFHATGVVSLFERLIKTGVAPVALREQYRMHPDISQISNKLIYQGQLRDGPATATKEGVDKFRKFMVGLARVSEARIGPGNAVVISPEKAPGMPWASQHLSGSTSRVNLLTARMIMRLVHLLVQKGGFTMTDIMVIAFYKDQVVLLAAIFSFAGFEGIRVRTIDSSQGSEAPVVIVDCVTLGAGADEGMGFLGEDQRRFNVAMTRAQVGRITIAHIDMLKVVNGKQINSGAWNEFFGQAKAANAVLTGRYLNEPTSDAMLEAHFDETRRTYEALIRAVPVSREEKQAGQDVAGTMVVGGKAFRTMTFIETTGATTADAVKWLTEARGDLAVAINAYFSEHGSDLPVEEI